MKQDTALPFRASNDSRPVRRPLPGRVVLVFQGGGALGAYQTGVYRALHEAGIEPDWVIGTSIGAINASLIAGNAPAARLERLHDFWERVTHPSMQRLVGGIPMVGSALANFMTMASGVAPFFRPNPLAFLSPHMPLGAGAAGYYDTRPLRDTLSGLVDFGRVNAGPVRLTVGAANLSTSEMRYFDSQEIPIGVEHVMASGALPPAFPAVSIDDALYWDGGILSNTPVEVVFDDLPRRDSLIFVVHLWNPSGPAPNTIWEVMNRLKDVQYSSRAVSHIRRQRELHRLRHIIKELAAKLPPDQRQDEQVQAMESYGCLTRMHVVRLLAPNLDREDHHKDIDFSESGIGQRSAAGYADTLRVLEAEPWNGEFDPLEGFILHEPKV